MEKFKLISIKEENIISTSNDDRVLLDVANALQEYADANFPQLQVKYKVVAND